MQHLAPCLILQLLVDKIRLILATALESAVDALFLGNGRSVFHVIVSRPVEFFLEDRVLVDGLKLGLEVT
jgi:uncharacterized membrane protein